MNENEENNEQETEIHFRIDEIEFKLPFSIFNKVLTRKLMEYIKDTTPVEHANLLRTDHLKAKYKNYKEKIDIYENIVQRLQRDLEHDEFAQPMRYNVKSYGQNLVIKPIKQEEMKKRNYPPPYPNLPPFNTQPSWKKVPPAPLLKINKTENEHEVLLTWNVKLTSETAIIEMYELYICQHTEEVPDTSMWKMMEEIKAIELPMVCTIDQFEKGIYYFALRAVDIHKRRGPFSGGKIII